MIVGGAGYLSSDSAHKGTERDICTFSDLPNSLLSEVILPLEKFSYYLSPGVGTTSLIGAADVSL